MSILITFWDINLRACRFYSVRPFSLQIQRFDKLINFVDGHTPFSLTLFIFCSKIL